MADNMSDFLENALLNHVLRGNIGGTAFAQPDTIFVALFSTPTTDVGGGTEAAGGAYARQQAVFSAIAAGSSSNTNNITFPKSTAAWGTQTHFALFSAVTGGDLLFHGPLAAIAVIDAADQTVEFEVGSIVVMLK